LYTVVSFADLKCALEMSVRKVVKFPYNAVYILTKQLPDDQHYCFGIHKNNGTVSWK